MGFEFPWWFGIVLLIYWFVAYFGIGAVLGMIASYAGMLAFKRPENIPENRGMRASVVISCALLGGLANLVAADVLLS